MNCETMEQDENDQNHKKDSTPVMDNKPNGKSQLKMLEHENRTTLQRQRELLADETDIALLPPLQDNIKRGNSLIASDFSMMPEDLVRVHAFDWPVQFASIIKTGGFDAVIGNPPWVSLTGKFGNDICSSDEIAYLTNRYKAMPTCRTCMSILYGKVSI